MPIKRWRLNKIYFKNPAPHPQRNTYRLVPLSTPVSSRWTVPLRYAIIKKYRKIIKKLKKEKISKKIYFLLFVC
jgi:hypothetical protein